MFEKFIQVYVYIFARTIFIKWNKALYRLSLGGLGILNHKTSIVSGEYAFLTKHLLLKTGALIDIGANKGEYSKLASEINPHMTVYSFEPHPKTFKQLSNNVSSLRKVTPINKGVSSSIGTTTLYDYPDKDGSSHASMFEQVITELHKSEDACSHEVEITTIDEFIRQEGLEKICLLKIDVEGNELEVMKGGQEALSSGKIDMIHFEFNEMNVFSRTYFHDFWELLTGYNLFRLLPSGMLEIKQYSPLYCEIFAYQNIVAIRK